MEEFDIEIKNNDAFFIGYTHNIHNIHSDKSHLFKTLRIIRVMKGKVIWKVGEASFELSKNDIILFDNICERRIARVIEPPFEYDLIAFPMSFNNEFISLFYKANKKYPLNEKIAGYLDDLIYEIKNSHENSYLCTKQLLNLILINISRISGENTASDISPNMSIIDTVLYIHENFSENLTVSSLAKKYSYSPEHFSRLFKKVVGISIKKYITGVRMENVILFLENDASNVLDIALKCGFSSSSGFYKAFKAYSKKTPLRYKNRGNHS